MEEYREVKSLKLRFHPNNTRNETMICFSTKNKDTRMAPVTLFLMSLLLTSNIFQILFFVSVVDFENVFVSWVCEKDLEYLFIRSLKYLLFIPSRKQTPCSTTCKPHFRGVVQ